MQLADQVKSYISSLRASLKTGEDVMVERLSGGVSCSVWKITAGHQRWVLKQAMGKLAVEDDWFSDVRRIEREQQAMVFLEPLLPEGSIPHLVHSDPEQHLYIMSCAPEGSITWKDRLMQGDFHADEAVQAGHILRAMHGKSGLLTGTEQALIFDDISFFHELRIEPFHRSVQRKHPELSPELEALIGDLTSDERRSCLVHGDFSPKNILVDPQGKLILLDYEVAHWGNPVFDLAFALTHLLLKGWVLGRQADARQLAEQFLLAYGYRSETGPRLLGHTGALLLARVDGKSPAGYLRDDELKQRIREQAIGWIRNPDLEADAGLNEAMKG